MSVLLREYVTVQQALAVTPFGKTYLKELIRSGRLPAKRLGARRLLIRSADLTEFLASLPSRNGEVL